MGPAHRAAARGCTLAAPGSHPPAHHPSAWGKKWQEVGAHCCCLALCPGHSRVPRWADLSGLAAFLVRSLFQALLDLASLRSDLAPHRQRQGHEFGLTHGVGALSLEASLHTDAEQAGGPHTHRHQGFSLKMMQIQTVKLPIHVGTMDPCGNQGMRWKHRPSPWRDVRWENTTEGRKEHRQVGGSLGLVLSSDHQPAAPHLGTRRSGARLGVPLGCNLWHLPPTLSQTGTPRCTKGVASLIAGWQGSEFLFQHANWSNPDQLSFLNHLETLIRWKWSQLVTISLLSKDIHLLCACIWLIESTCI